MNIHDFMHETSPQSESTEAVWELILARRQDTFRAFAKIEQKNGFVKPTVNVNTSEGQEILRILGFRVLEEAAESVMANTPAHRKEEAIDAINYLLSMPLLDGSLVDKEQLVVVFNQVAAEYHWSGRPILQTDLGILTEKIAGELADTFRNRAWMKQAQDLYFAGVDEMIDTMVEGMKILLLPFNSFDEFFRYYIAKDEVLKFRLRSEY